MVSAELKEVGHVTGRHRGCEVCQEKRATRTIQATLDGKPFEKYYLCDEQACFDKLKELV